MQDREQCADGVSAKETGKTAENSAFSGLVIERLSKSYGREQVLKNVSLTLAPGSALGVCGGNGTGKTTLLQLIASILKPDEGRIMLNGVAAGRGAKYREMIGFVPQDIALSQRLSVRHNLDFWASVNGLSGQALKQSVDRVTALTNIGNFLDKRVSACSGGMQRRVNLAAGLVGNPLLILLDEPTAGIDEENRDPILEAILSLKQDGKMVMMVNHYHQELSAVCDRVVTLRDGFILGSMPPQTGG